MATIYFAGGEDESLYGIGGTSVITTAGKFRSTYARCALQAGSTSAGVYGYWQTLPNFSVSSLWFGSRTIQSGIGGTNIADQLVVGFYDASNILRIAILQTGTAFTFKCVKVNAAGTVTQLGSNFTMIHGSSTNQNKFDIHIVDNAAGTVTVYLDIIQVFTYSGDTTTDGVSTLAAVRLGSMGYSSTVAVAAQQWSEIIVADTDTRSWDLQTLPPVANGNTHNFDVGTPAAANVNEITLSDATLDGATANGLIDQYTIPAIAAGTYTIVAMGVSARMQKGATGPSKMDLGVRVTGTDYWSADQTLATAWGPAQNWWSTDPSTGVTWTALPTNIGLKAVT